jgi:hypothetical protein
MFGLGRSNGMNDSDISDRFQKVTKEAMKVSNPSKFEKEIDERIEPTLKKLNKLLTYLNENDIETTQADGIRMFMRYLTDKDYNVHDLRKFMKRKI